MRVMGTTTYHHDSNCEIFMASSHASLQVQRDHNQAFALWKARFHPNISDERAHSMELDVGMLNLAVMFGHHPRVGRTSPLQLFEEATLCFICQLASESNMEHLAVTTFTSYKWTLSQQCAAWVRPAGRNALTHSAK
jgi:hypothetical protein